jgi:hypothetical protein
MPLVSVFVPVSTSVFLLVLFFGAILIFLARIGF